MDEVRGCFEGGELMMGLCMLAVDVDGTTLGVFIGTVAGCAGSSPHVSAH